MFSDVADVSTPLEIVQNGVNINSSLTTLTNAYDGADQLIGNNLDYILNHIICQGSSLFRKLLAVQ